MRIALCLFGKVGGMSRDGLYADLDLDKLHQNFEEHIMHGDHHFDIFVHSWSWNRADDIINLYAPTDYIIEKEKFIPPPEYQAHRAHFEKAWEDFPQHDNRKDAIHAAHHDLWAIEIFNSRWYSQSRAAKLMDSYSAKTGIKYDAVLLSRFDCAWSVKFNFEQIHPDVFYFLGGQFQGFLNQHAEIIDFWFASGQKNISAFGGAWDHIQQNECFEFEDGRLCKEHFNGMTSHKMARHLIENHLQYPLEPKYNQHVDCDLARASDSYWTTTDLGKII